MIVDCALYRDGRRVRGGLDGAALADAVHDSEGFVWMGLHEPSTDEFDQVADEFSLHELAIEDAVSAHQRPKVEVYGDSLFVVLKTVTFVAATNDIELGEILVFVGARFVVVVRHGGGSELASVRRRLERDPSALALGPSAVLHAIVDRVVDDYQPVMEELGSEVEAIEYEVFGAPEPADVGRIYKLKREVLEAVRALRPLARPLELLADGFHPLVTDEVRPYFRDVHDHVVRITEQLEDYSELLSSVLDANLAQVGVKQNEDMRKISAWVAMAAVPTMLAGVWGMNFEHMPELDWRFGYPMALGLMAVSVTVLYRLFRRAGWL